MLIFARSDSPHVIWRQVNSFGLAVFAAGMLLIVLGILLLSEEFPRVSCAPIPDGSCIASPNLIFELVGALMIVMGYALTFVSKSKGKITPASPGSSRYV
jgi:uncharacterized membrane protein